MANRLKPLNLLDFTGGLNLRADAFHLADNEGHTLLNVEVDPRGGFQSRKGWKRWNTGDIAAGTWNPRSCFVHELSTGIDWVMVANDGKVEVSSSSTFATLNRAAATPLTVAASPHLADFAPWGDRVYIACGRTQQAAKWDGSGDATLLTASAAANWNNNYAAPALGKMPKAELVATHSGFVFVANTEEDSNNHPNRLRWSHPNNPEDWAVNDFLDVREGGGKITAIVSFEDHLLIFKTASVWALYGYDSDTWQLVNVSRTLGAVHRQVVARSEKSVYFVAWPAGVHRVAAGRVEEVSDQLRPVTTSREFNPSATDNMWLGWLGQRLWWAVPYWEDGVAADARSIFVFDPSLGQQGSWTLFRSSTEQGLGPFAQGGHGGGTYSLYGLCRCGPHMVEVDALDQAHDTITGSAVGFETSYRTRWLYARTPDLKKSWRRPTFVVKEKDSPYLLSCRVYTDYDEANAARAFQVQVDGNSTTAVYSATTPPAYGDGTTYGPPVQGSTLERGSSLGPGRSIQLRIDGEVGKAWGVDGIVFKYLARRFR